MKSKSLLKPIPVRFNSQTKVRIKKASKEFGLTSSDIIRQAVEAQLPEWEHSGVLTIHGKASA